MLTIRSGRHPHEITILGICILSGIGNFVTYRQSASTAIVRLLPDLIGRSFYLGLAAFAVVALVGVFWPGSAIVGPLIERAGLIGVAGLCVFLGLLIVVVGGWRGVFFGAMTAGFGVANVVRAVQIQRDLARIRAAAVVTDSTDQLDGGKGTV